MGSGAVLMNHYSPFKVAELFKQLEAMAPGRIDLGMGRATAGPVLDLALQQNRQHPAQADHQQQVLETLAWLYESFPEDHPFAGHPLMTTVPEVPQTWLLGSSPNGSRGRPQFGVRNRWWRGAGGGAWDRPGAAAGRGSHGAPWTFPCFAGAQVWVMRLWRIGQGLGS